jgi:hypothetical protein
LPNSGEETSGKTQVAQDNIPLSDQLKPRDLKQALDRCRCPAAVDSRFAYHSLLEPTRSCNRSERNLHIFENAIPSRRIRKRCTNGRVKRPTVARDARKQVDRNLFSDSQESFDDAVRVIVAITRMSLLISD